MEDKVITKKRSNNKTLICPVDGLIFPCHFNILCYKLKNDYISINSLADTIQKNYVQVLQIRHH